MKNDLSPTTNSKILTLTVATHWGDIVADNPDSDTLLENDTAHVAWLAYQALTALHEHAPDIAEAIVRENEFMEVSEVAHAALARIVPDPCWLQQSFTSTAQQTAVPA
ncbi:hypothetical protein [Streptomyces sp. NPDC003857]